MSLLNNNESIQDLLNNSESTITINGGTHYWNVHSSKKRTPSDYDGRDDGASAICKECGELYFEYECEYCKAVAIAANQKSFIETFDWCLVPFRIIKNIYMALMADRQRALAHNVLESDLLSKEEIIDTEVFEEVKELPETKQLELIERFSEGELNSRKALFSNPENEKFLRRA
jgi:hypothetical protein